MSYGSSIAKESGDQVVRENVTLNRLINMLVMIYEEFVMTGSKVISLDDSNILKCIIPLHLSEISVVVCLREVFWAQLFFLFILMIYSFVQNLTYYLMLTIRPYMHQVQT